MSLTHPPIYTMSISRIIILSFENRETYGAADDISHSKAAATVLTYIRRMLPKEGELGLLVFSRSTSDSNS